MKRKGKIEYTWNKGRYISIKREGIKKKRRKKWEDIIICSSRYRSYGDLT
jgi:hypothetical protein